MQVDNTTHLSYTDRVTSHDLNAIDILALQVK
jgi:hypothetical protein